MNKDQKLINDAKQKCCELIDKLAHETYEQSAYTSKNQATKYQSLQLCIDGTKKELTSAADNLAACLKTQVADI